MFPEQAGNVKLCFNSSTILVNSSYIRSMFGQKRDSQPLLAVGEILVSQEITSELFACDIAKCKGACCVEGDVGAPLEDKEIEILEEIYPVVASYLPESGQRAIQDQGTYVKDFTDEFSTPLVEGKECAYTVFDEQGIAHCGIEKAWNDGKIDFRKPVSCHLYPIRIHKSRNLEALNYDRWDICAPACIKGEIGGIRVYEFLKEALIRKYGESFYEELDTMVKARGDEPE